MLKQGLEAVLGQFQPDPQSRVPAVVQKAVYLAGLLQARATELQTPAERRQQAELDRMMQRPEDKSTLMQITDQAFRARSPYRVADQLTHVLDVQGVPRFFSPLERAALKGFQSFGSYLPGVAVPLVKEYMQRETANVILPADRELLARHLQQRSDEGVRMNVNVLGEALLGEREAEHRLKRYLEALQRPEIEVISVKISTIFSQIWPLARRALDRSPGRSLRVAVSRRHEEPVPPCRRAGGPQVRVLGHGRVPRHEHHVGRVHEVARPAGPGPGGGRHRASSRTSPTRTARNCSSMPGRANASRAAASRS